MLVVRVGEVDLLVEPSISAGSQPTSRVGDAAAWALDAFERAQDSIVQVAVSTAGMIGRAAARGVRPDHVQVAFGLKFSAQGDVFVAKASGEASLTVTLTYDAKPGPSAPSAAGAVVAQNAEAVEGAGS